MENAQFPTGHPALCYELCDPNFEVTPHIHTPAGVFIVDVVDERVPVAVKDEHKLRAARRLVEEVLAAGWVGAPFAGAQLEAVRQALGELGGDYRPDDPAVTAAVSFTSMLVAEPRDDDSPERKKHG